MSDESQQPIVVKTVKRNDGGAHGGAWKIAYADFVTAMMAFFLLMWLLGSTTQSDLNAIAAIFNNASSLVPKGSKPSKPLTEIHGNKPFSIINHWRCTPANAAQDTEEERRLADFKAELLRSIDEHPILKPFRNQLTIDSINEGLRIQIVDEKNRPMFDLASSEVKPYARTLLRELGRILDRLPNRIAISGHTDATPYADGEVGFGNWELSTNRANASRRELIAGGLSGGKILRVFGMAATIPHDANDPTGPTNRRIGIVLLNKRSENAILANGLDKEIRIEREGDLTFRAK